MFSHGNKRKKGPLPEEWREDVVHNTRDYYSAVKIKRTAICSHRVGLGTVTLGESEPDTEADVRHFMGWSQNHGADRPTGAEAKSQMCKTHLAGEGGINAKARMKHTH